MPRRGSINDCRVCKPRPRVPEQGSIGYSSCVPVSIYWRANDQQRPVLTAFHSYLYIWIYTSTLDTAIVVYLPELFPNHLRAKGMSLGIAALTLTDLVSSSGCSLSEPSLTRAKVLLQVTPTAMRTIGWKFYLVFICITAVAVVWAFFEVKETKGVPLEEIAALFGEREQVTVFAADVHVDHTKDEVVVDSEVGGIQHREKSHAQNVEGRAITEA